VTVSGMVNDIVVGTVNPQQATVTVNGITAEVLNRSFVARDVPLNIGSNTVQAIATDRAGNRATTSASVNRLAATGGLKLFSGHNQSGLAGSMLPAPLIVALTNAQGAPVPNQPVVFRVVGLDGTVAPSTAPGGTLSAVAVNTDGEGKAKVFYRLGSRAGGGNIVEASAAGVAATVDFVATGTPGNAKLMVVDSGNNQAGVVGQPLPLPFIAIVTDAKNNRLANIPVNFEVKGGGGGFGATHLDTYQTTSDSDGRVAATLILGPDQGVGNNLVEANFPGNTSFAAAFTATGLVPGPAARTRISGVVLDNSNNPIPGVTMRLLQITQGNRSNIPQEMAEPVQTDAQGQFVMQPVPVGVFKLMTDGGTASRAGVWPTLDFDMITVSGQNNTLGMPIFLPELNPNNRICVNETTGGTLTLPDVPGFALTVAPGSATFPGGSRNGCVSVTPVNMDKVPMAPGFGQQPRFVVTIQPVGTHFSPAARMTIPNVDGLAPRAVTEMYSYDHDLASFVAIGSATVSEDGATITSDPGAGVIKAGWHCGGDPNTSGSAGTCPTCQECKGTGCVAIAGTPTCDDGDECTTNDRCADGSCKGEPVVVTDISGACVAPVGILTSYTAVANDLSKVKWQSGGAPASGTGRNYSVAFASEGQQTISAGCAVMHKSKQVDVAQPCGALPAALFDSTSSGGTPCPSCFGEVNTPITHSVEFMPCVESGNWCFREKKFKVDFTVGVQSLGRTDISSANSPAVTAGSCCQVIRDLTPDPASDCGRPPRTQYYSNAITLIHENFHVSDLRDNYLRPKMTDLENFVKQQANCTNCKSDKSAELTNRMEQLYSEAFNSFTAGGLHECRAYGDGVARYNALIAAIRVRATQAAWAGCPP
jgi:hypothetical protein